RVELVLYRAHHCATGAKREIVRGEQRRVKRVVTQNADHFGHFSEGIGWDRRTPIVGCYLRGQPGKRTFDVSVENARLRADHIVPGESPFERWRSIQRPSFSSLFSWRLDPTSCRPIGRPLSPVQSGKVRAGK